MNHVRRAIVVLPLFLCVASAPPAHVAAGPVVSSFVPRLAAAGVSVTVTGTGLIATGRRTVVDFNGVLASHVSPASATKLVVVVPAGATSGPIGVTTSSGTGHSTTSFTVASPPTVSDVAPVGAKVGAQVTVTGTSFTGATAVSFNGKAAAFKVASATSIVAKVPAGAATGSVTVAIPGASGSWSQSFVVLVAPAVTTIQPAGGVVGDVISVTGANFYASGPGGPTTVRIGTKAVPSVSIASNTSLTFPVPSGATTGRIMVSTGGGTATSVVALTVIGPPIVSAVSPASGPSGGTVTITGSSLTAATAVMFGGGVTATPQDVEPGSLRVVVPAGATSGDVLVETRAGSGASTKPFVVTFSLTALSRLSGPTGAPVVIAGLGFTSVSSVGFGSQPATLFHVDSATQITATVPAGATSGPITVVTQHGSTASAEGFSPVATAAGTVDVSTDSDVVNGDTSSVAALLGQPGLDGISLREAITAVDNTTGTTPLTVAFDPVLSGTSIVFAGPYPPPPISRDNTTVDGLVDQNGAPAITLDGSNVTIALGTLFVRASHVVIEHLEFTNVVSQNAALAIGAGDAQGFAPAPPTTTDVTVRDNIFSNVGIDQHARAIGLSASTIGANTEISHVTIENNAFIHYRNDDTLGMGAPGNGNTVDNVVITRNTFTDTELAVEIAIAGGAGGQILDTTVSHNTFTDDRQPVSLLVIDQPSSSANDVISNTHIIANTFVGSTNPNVGLNAGIGNSNDNTISGTVIDDNLFDGGDGIFATSGASGAVGNAIDGVQVTNNTFVGTTHGLYATIGAAGNTVQGATATNDIFTNVDWPVTGDAVEPAAYGLFWGNCGTYAGSNGNICADPLFVDPAAGDFHLQPGSPAIDAGTSTDAPTTDLECRQRYDDPGTPNTGGGDYDIGAYEFGGTIVACPS